MTAVDGEQRLPRTSELYQDVIAVLRELGGSGTNEEIDQRIVTRRGITEEQQQLMRADGRRPQFLQYISEAKSNLKKVGYLEQSERGV